MVIGGRVGRVTFSALIGKIYYSFISLNPLLYFFDTIFIIINSPRGLDVGIVMLKKAETRKIK